MDIYPLNFHSRGLSLIELLVVIAIAAILAFVADAAFQSTISGTRVRTEANNLLGDLEYARAEAVKRGLPVTACPSTDSLSCSGGFEWNSGWIVFTDPNANGVVDPGEVVLHLQAPVPGGNSFVLNNLVKSITFNRNGYAIGLPAGTQLTLHDRTANPALTRCLTISMVGLLAIQRAGGTCL
ncbi:MAG: GspH/FimT family pseudopilin [Gammaproteobacteria bacterium]|nr:GspH/FimT family pseudopilin [Gammaproteobacteria bacterium]MDE2249972.1 GspH/FimT family pseudopilin [Gammaproteobacteria bacterium]